MVTVECKTQDEADAAAVRGDVIVWRAGHLVARDSASVYAYGSARVYAYGSAVVNAYGSARVTAYDSASVTARDSAVVSAFNSAVVNAYGSARVSARDSASVCARDSASVCDIATCSPLRRDRPRIVIGPLGSRNATLGASIPANGGDPIIYAGCWTGTLTDFAKRVDTVYPDGQFRAEYHAAIAFIRAITGSRQ